MKPTIYDIRRENIELLLKETGDSREAFVKKIGKKSVTQISHYLTKNELLRRNVTDKLARKIEEFYDKPIGWMDVSHSDNDQPCMQSENYDPMEHHLAMIYRCTKHAIQVAGKPMTPAAFLKRYKHALDVAFGSNITEEHLQAVLTVLFAADNICD